MPGRFEVGLAMKYQVLLEGSEEGFAVGHPCSSLPGSPLAGRNRA